MNGQHLFLFGLLGVVSYSHGWISGPVVEQTVRPGDNITLYCDCKLSLGVYIVWYRNCSHENQPSLVLSTGTGLSSFDKNYPRFEFVRNSSSESYNLLIMNVTDSDEGLYYCGTERTRVEDGKYIMKIDDYTYGNITTRITLRTQSLITRETPQDCSVCWMLLFSLCPVLAVLSSLLSSLLVYYLCAKKAKEPEIDQQKPETRGQARLNQEEDVCYAALEIRQASQRPKKKRTQNSDFSTYSAINTLRM